MQNNILFDLYYKQMENTKSLDDIARILDKAHKNMHLIGEANLLYIYNLGNDKAQNIADRRRSNANI